MSTFSRMAAWAALVSLGALAAPSPGQARSAVPVLEHSPEPAPEPSVEDAYRAYLAAIDKARATIRASAGVRKGHEAEDIREGEVFLRSMVNTSLIWGLSDIADHPLMALSTDLDNRLGLDNPDNLYYMAMVDDRHEYLITGTRGLAQTFAIQASVGLPGLSATKGMTVSHINGRDLEVGPDGRFTITLSPTRPASGNWMELKPGVDNVLVRFSFADWKREQQDPGSISIRVRGAPAGSPPAAVTPAIAAHMLAVAADAIEEQASYYSGLYDQAVARGTNYLVGPQRADGGQATATHQWNFIGPFEIAPDQAIVIKVKDAPQARYYNIEGADPWMNTFPFRDRQSSLNHTQLRVDDDGYIRFVVALKDPGVPNWIDTTGQTHGWLWSRWQEVEGTIGPEFRPEVTVLPLAKVRKALPADTPRVTPAQRRSQLAERAALLDQRFAHADPARPELSRRLKAVEALVGHRLALTTLK